MGKADNAKQIAAMKKLGMSDDEIRDCLQADDDIEHGADLFALTKEQEEASKQARKMGHRKTPTVYKLDNTGGKRSRKENPAKREIISEIFAFLNENASFEVKNSEITNPERMIFFQSDAESYEITLTCKRKPKN